MTAADYDELVTYLDERFDDGVVMATRYTETSSEFLLGEDAYEEFVATRDTRSPEKMHEDAVSDLKHADVSGDLYGNEIRANVTVSELGTGVNLFVSHREGIYIWFSPETTVELPDDVDACLDLVSE